MHHLCNNVMHHIVFQKFHIILSLTHSDAVCPWFLFVFFFFKSLDMASKVGRKFKTKANKNTASSSSAFPLFDRVRFLSAKSMEIYETLTKYRSIWGEREIVLCERSLYT